MFSMALTQLTGGKFTDMEGSPLSNGGLDFELSHDAQDSSNSAQVVGGLRRRIFLDNNGNAVTGSNIQATDALVPAGTYYIVTAFTNDGRQAFKSPQYWQIPSSPDPFDLGSLTPFTPPGGGFGTVGESLTIQTNGINNASQNLLDFEDTASVTWSNSGGQMRATASSSPSVSTNAHSGSLSLTQTASTIAANKAPLAYPSSYFSVPLPSATSTTYSTLLAPAVGNAVTISSYAITSNVITCQYTSTYPLVASQQIVLWGFPTSTFLNGKIATVSATGLSSTQFEAQFTHADTSATETGFASGASRGSLSTASSWVISSDRLYTFGGTGNFINTTFLIQGSAHNTALNGTTANVEFSGVAQTTSFTHADALGEFDSGYMTSGTSTVTICGWFILSDVLYLVLSSTGVALLGATVTLGGFTTGAAILNGQTVTLAGSSTFVTISPYTAANDSATESLTTIPVVNGSVATAGSSSASNLFTLGILSSYQATVSLAQVSSGRYWIGFGDARYLNTGLLGTNLTPESDAVAELVTDAPTFTVVGFRFSKVAGDTHLQCVSNNAGTQTTVDSGLTPAPGDEYVLGVSPSGSSLVFTINGSPVATISTNLPDTGLALSASASVDNVDNTGNQIYMKVYSVRWNTTV
jgi:hypothetical protein